MSVNIIDVVQYIFPGQIALGRVSFRKPDDDLLIAIWEVPGVEQPTEEQLIQYGLVNERAIVINSLALNCVSIVQSVLDDTALNRGYYNSASCISYMTSTNVTWQTEAECFIAWRDSVWNYAYTLYATLQGNQDPIPTEQEFRAGIPTIVWPN